MKVPDIIKIENKNANFLIDKKFILVFDGINLNNFIINPEKYLIKDPRETSMVPPLPEQPQPNPAVVQTPPPVTQTGLTMAEQALLSEEEKMIKLRDRGLV